MARSLLPDALTRRVWIEDELDPKRAAAIGEAYLEAGRVTESIVFLAKGGELDRLRELEARAAEQGDAFLLREVCRALGGEPSREQWRRLAERAAVLGKERYASEAIRQAERLEE